MEYDLLHSTFIFLAAAVIAVPISQLLGLGSVIGYLIAGVAIGPWGLSFISNVDAIMHISEFGVVLLLFLIGLELKPKKLWQMRTSILGLGGSQVIITTLVIGAISTVLGAKWQTALIIGMGLALSSTAIALRVLEEQKLTGTPTGQSGFSVLLFQDIAVVPILAILPLLTGDFNGHWIDVFYMIAGLSLLIACAHFLLNPIFRFIIMCGVSELFTVAALLLVIGIAVVMEEIGLSMALGTFLAGVLLAESEFRHELETAIEPFKGVLLGLFFISVGMAVNVGLLFSNPAKILLTVLALVSIKATIIYLLATLFTSNKKSCNSKIAIILSQGGEFAFVIFSAAATEGLINPKQSSYLLLAVSLSMLTTPVLLMLQRKWLAHRLNSTESTPHIDDRTVNMSPQDPAVIISGFGRFGQVIGRLMYANKVKITVLESDVSQLKLLRGYGYKVFYGNATQLDLLRAAGADTAEAIILCTNSPDEIKETVRLCQLHFPHLKIMARARSRLEAAWLLNHEVTDHSRETFHSALDLGRKLLIELGMHPYQAQRAETHFRKLDDAMLKTFLPRSIQGPNSKADAILARQELEDVFAQEMESDNHSHNYWK